MAHLVLVHMSSPGSSLLTPERVPKKVEEVRQALGAKGVSLSELTPEKLAAVVDPKTINSLQTGYRKSMSDKAKAGYTQANAAEKKEWLCQYIVDPKLGKSEGFTSTVASQSEKTKSGEFWLTQEELGGPEHLNCPKHAEILVKSGTLREREHEQVPLALAGVKQYFWVRSQVV